MTGPAYKAHHRHRETGARQGTPPVQWLYQLDALSLWLDEAYSVWFSDQSWHRLWQDVPDYETHPVLYYSVLKLWRALGSDAVTLRLLSTLLSLLSIPFIAATAWHCAPNDDRRSAALLAALLFCLSNTQLDHAQDARPYAMMTLAMSAALFCLVYILQHPARAARPFPALRRDPGMLAACLGLALSLALLMWSHNIGPLFCALLGFMTLIWAIWTRQAPLLRLNLLLIAGLALLLYWPNVLILLRQTTAMDATGFWLHPPRLRLVLTDFAVLTLGLGPLVLIGAWYLARRMRPRIIPALLVGLALGPMLLTAVASHIWHPIYLRRTFAASQVPILVLLAFLPPAFHTRFGLRTVHLTTGLVLGAALLSALAYHYRVLAPGMGRQENYREVVARALETADTEPVTMVVLPVSVALPLTYYRDETGADLQILSTPAPYPARDPTYRYPAGGNGVPEITERMVQDLMPRLAEAQEVWFVKRSVGLFDPNRHLVEAMDSAFPCLIETLPPYAEHRSRAKADGTCSSKDTSKARMSFDLAPPPGIGPCHGQRGQKTDAACGSCCHLQPAGASESHARAAAGQPRPQQRSGL